MEIKQTSVTSSLSRTFARNIADISNQRKKCSSLPLMCASRKPTLILSSWMTQNHQQDHFSNDKRRRAATAIQRLENMTQSIHPHCDCSWGCMILVDSINLRRITCECDLCIVVNVRSNTFLILIRPIGIFR